MSPLGNEDARAQVGTNGGLSQRIAELRHLRNRSCAIGDWEGVGYVRACDDISKGLDAAKLRIEEALKALPDKCAWCYFVDREAVLKIIREIL